MIEFRNVHAAYDDQLPVLRDVSFTIADGEFVAFVGTAYERDRTQSWLPLPESRSADLLQHRARRATLRIQSARAPR